MPIFDFLSRDHEKGSEGEAQQNLIDRMGNIATLGGVADAVPKVNIPGLSTLGGALSMVGLSQDVYDISQNGLNDQNGLSGAANAMGTGSFITGAMATSEGAAGLFGAGALSSASSVLAAGAGGIALGMLYDQGVDAVGDLITGEEGDHSLSRMWARGLGAVDEAQRDAGRAVGLYDEEEPAYTQTAGWAMTDAYDAVAGVFDDW